MLILILFSFLAGIATVLSPCVIPVLPALLSASGGKGPARSLGVIFGVIVSFVFFTLSLTAILHLTGISPNFLRYIAIGLIALFGLAMIFPSLGEKFTRWTSGVADLGQKVQGKSKLFGTGFWSGFVLGMALGLVWTPCAGPILAAITTLVATSSISFETFILTLAYSLGAAIPMFLIIWGGQKAIDSSRTLSRHAETIRKVFGFLMIGAAFLLAFHLEVKFQQFAIQYVPMLNVEDHPIVKEELAKLAVKSPFGQAVEKAEKSPYRPSALPKIAEAPNFVGISSWINSPPLTKKDLKGKVYLVDFWTYSCINCLRTLPYITKWYDTYKDQGFVVVGVHTPEFAFEKDRDNVIDATKRLGIHYPVALDNDYATWQAFDNQYWPAHYLIDQEGILRAFHFGEGGYNETENQIRSLLGLAPLEVKAEPTSIHRPLTRETYLGNLRGDRYTAHPGVLGDDEVALHGPWKKEDEKIVSEGDNSYLDLNFIASRVYLVMGGTSASPVTVLLDGKPLPKEDYTKDMDSEGNIFVKEPRKYDILNLHMNYGRHTLTLKVPKGIEPFVFTFGDEP